MKNAKPNPFNSFNFNDSNVNNEVAAMNNIFKSDYKLLVLGFSENPQADVEKIKNKMKTAGAEKVYSEMQAQLKAQYSK